MQFSKYPRIADLKAQHPEQAEVRDGLTLKGVAAASDQAEAKQIWTEAGDEDLRQAPAFLFLLTLAAHPIP